MSVRLDGLGRFLLSMCDTALGSWGPVKRMGCGTQQGPSPRLSLFLFSPDFKNGIHFTIFADYKSDMCSL